MFSRIHNKLHLYLRRGFWASAAIAVASLALAAGGMPFQRSRRDAPPSDVPLQHKTPHKLRAIALVERKTEPGGTVTIHVVPITILANDSFHDASIYESRPRPMVLESGVVYEVQKTGLPVGYVTVTNSSNSPEGWVALGRWQAIRQFQAATRPKPVAPAAAETDDRPVLHREGQTVAPPTPTPTPTPEQTQSESSDSGRPTLHRPGEEPQPTPTPTPEEPQSSSSDSDRPVLHRRPDSSDQQTAGSQTQSTTQPASQAPQQTEAEQAPEDPNRPILRHRKSGSDEADTTPVASKTSQPPASGPSTIISAAPSSDPGTQVFVGISDVQSNEPRSYDYHWKPEEETAIQAKMRKLALAQLPRENAEAEEKAMTNVVIRSFDLDLSNDAVVVITAEFPGVTQTPAPSSSPARKTSRSASVAAKAPAGKPVTRYVAVIARVDIDGDPQKLAASVTDSSRLDVAPRMELIDAVDVNGNGQASLLFREYDFDQKTFIVYGVGHGTVTKVFEGASEPIHPKSAESP